MLSFLFIANSQWKTVVRFLQKYFGRSWFLEKLYHLKLTEKVFKNASYRMLSFLFIANSQWKTAVRFLQKYFWRSWFLEKLHHLKLTEKVFRIHRNVCFLFFLCSFHYRPLKQTLLFTNTFWREDYRCVKKWKQWKSSISWWKTINPCIWNLSPISCPPSLIMQNFWESRQFTLRGHDKKIHSLQIVLKYNLQVENSSLYQG